MLKKIRALFVNKIFLCLVVLFFLAFFFRAFLLDHNLFFGPEQGIDYLVIKDLVVNHKMTLIGSKTDIGGIFHGPIYDYLSTIPFFLSQGNPLVGAYFFIVLQSLTVFFLYLLGKELFHKRVGLIAAVLFVFSFNAIVYSHWLSNPPLSIPLAGLYFLFLIRFLKGKKWDLLGAAITLGFLAQAEFLNILFFAVITFFIIIFFFKRFAKQNIFYTLLCGIIAVGLSVGYIVLFDLRHQFLMTHNIAALLQGNTGYHVTLVESFIGSITAFFKIVVDIIIPSSLLFGIVIFLLSIASLFTTKNKKFNSVLLLWLFAPLVLLIIVHHQILDQFFVGLIPGVFLLIAVLIDTIWHRSMWMGIIVLSLILGCNFFAWMINIPQNKNIFFQSTQLDLKYSDELKVIDRIYAEANGKPFSFQAYTIPYWQQQGWQYLFWQYGQKKYGYLPIDEKAKILFVIIQSDPNGKTYQDNWLKNTVSKWGTATKQFSYGALTVKELQVAY